jgi:hypothetical protein
MLVMFVVYLQTAVFVLFCLCKEIPRDSQISQQFTCPTVANGEVETFITRWENKVISNDLL